MKGQNLQGCDPEYELLVLSTGVAGKRQRQTGRIESLAATANWSRLGGLLHSNRLLVTLGPRLLEAAPQLADGAFEAELEQARRAASFQDTLLRTTLEQCHSALAAAGIRSTALKGPILGEAVYGEPGRRVSGDVDLLIAPEQLRDAVGVLNTLGYEEPTDPVADHDLPLLHFTMIHKAGQLPPTELHWRIHWYESRFASECLLAPSPDSPFDWRPAAHHELAALLLFYARDGFTGLRQPADLSGWWDNFGEQLDIDAFCDLLSAYPTLQEAISTALIVAEKVTGLPAAALLKRTTPGRRSRLAVRLSDPYPYPSRQQLYAEIGLIDGLLTPLRQLGAFAKRQIFPPPEVIREHADRAQGVAIGRPAYAVRILARFALALGRLLHLPFAARARFGPWRPAP